MHAQRIVVRLAVLGAFLGALCLPLLAQQVKPDDPGRPERPSFPHGTPMPFATPTPLPMPTLPPLALPTPRSVMPARAFLPGVPRGTVNVSNLPPLPRPFGREGMRQILSASGATMIVVVDPNLTGTCSTTVGTIYNTGCQIGFYSQNLPTSNTYQDYYIDATSGTATLIGSTYTGPNNDPGWLLTLSHQGTYVLAAFNTVTLTWDAVTYITVGSATVLGTYSDVALNVPSTQFVAKNTSTVYINANGLTPTDSYYVYAEYTATGATCVFGSPAESPAPAANALCNPANSAGQTAPGGTITASWNLSTALNPGTYSIVLYDKTAGRRLAQRQVVLTKNGGSAAVSMTPSGGNASPGPAATPSTVFAFDGTSDASDSGFTASVSGLTASRAYRTSFSDPNGTVYQTAANTASAGGAISVATAFSQSLAPYNYIGNTYTFQVYDTVTQLAAVAQSFKILGYHVLTQFTSPALSTSLVLPGGGNATSGIQFTNDGETQFGSGNADPIAKIEFKTYTASSGPVGIVMSEGAGGTSCGASCETETVTDSNGQSWTAVNVCGGSGVNQYCKLTLTPVTAGQSLAKNATVTVPSITFTNTVGSHCSSGCAASTTEIPADGITWSTDGSSTSSNPTYFTNGFGVTYSASAHIILYGERAGTSGTLTVGKDAHGYTPRFNQAMYAINAPSAAPANQNDVFALTVANASSAGSAAITKLQVTVPTAFSPASTLNFVQVDPVSPTAWTTTACPSGAPSTAFCLQNSGANGGIAAGTSQTIYFDINPPPQADFAYTDVGVQAITPAPFSITADGNATVFVGTSNPQTVDTLAIGSYALNSTLITPLFTPTSEGTNTNNQVTISVQNASTASTPFPDYLDLFAIDLPTANTLTNITPVTAGYSYLGSTTPSAGVTRYWFGLCAGQFVSAAGPPNDGIPSCGSATEQSAIAPGATFSFTANIQTASSNITATEYAHGADGGGWSAGRTFTLTVTPTSAVAGFIKAGTYGSPPTVTSNTQPTIGSDTDTTYGNSFVYEIKNTGSNAITSATITIPGLNTGGANGADASGQPWTITATPTLSGNGSAGCTVSSSTSAQANGTNGAITITGCTGLTAGNVLDVSFPAKAPYNVNYNYQFGTVVNGSIAASEAWFSDSIMKIVLTGSISVAVDPSNPGPGGSTPTVSCAGCAFDLALNQIQFRNIPNSTTDNYTDVMRVSIYTDAGTTNSWTLSVQASNNPATTAGTYANELVLGVDSANSSSGTGMVIDQSSLGVVPTATTMQLAHGPTGITPRRLPFDLIENFSISIGTEAIVPQTSTLTYTFIAN